MLHDMRVSKGKPTERSKTNTRKTHVPPNGFRWSDTLKIIKTRRSVKRPFKLEFSKIGSSYLTWKSELGFLQRRQPPASVTLPVRIYNSKANLLVCMSWSWEEVIQFHCYYLSNGGGVILALRVAKIATVSIVNLFIQKQFRFVKSVKHCEYLNDSKM